MTARRSRPGMGSARWWRERALFAEAFVLVAGARVALDLGPRRLVGPVVRRMRADTLDPVDGGDIALEVGRAVRRANDRVPRATCLTAAVAGWVMLRRRRIPATLHLGARSDGGAMRAHAWLTTGSNPVVGAETAADYAPFPVG